MCSTLCTFVLHLPVGEADHVIQHYLTFHGKKDVDRHLGVNAGNQRWILPTWTLPLVPLDGHQLCLLLALQRKHFHMKIGHSNKHCIVRIMGYCYWIMLLYQQGQWDTVIGSCSFISKDRGILLLDHAPLSARIEGYCYWIILLYQQGQWDTVIGSCSFISKDSGILIGSCSFISKDRGILLLDHAPLSARIVGYCYWIMLLISKDRGILLLESVPLCFAQQGQRGYCYWDKVTFFLNQIIFRHIYFQIQRI